MSPLASWQEAVTEGGPLLGRSSDSTLVGSGLTEEVPRPCGFISTKNEPRDARPRAPGQVFPSRHGGPSRLPGWWRRGQCPHPWVCMVEGRKYCTAQWLRVRASTGRQVPTWMIYPHSPLPSSWNSLPFIALASLLTPKHAWQALSPQGPCTCCPPPRPPAGMLFSQICKCIAPEPASFRSLLRCHFSQ